MSCHENYIRFIITKPEGKVIISLILDKWYNHYIIIFHRLQNTTTNHTYQTTVHVSLSEALKGGKFMT